MDRRNNSLDDDADEAKVAGATSNANGAANADADDLENDAKLFALNAK